MQDMHAWRYNEFVQVGKDYNCNIEVAVYEETHSKFRDLIQESNELLDALGVKPGESIIDFGCGTGVLAIQAALRGLKVIAVDISTAMLAYAEEKALTQNIETIDFIHSGFLNYAHVSAPVDHIVSSFSLHHLPDFWKLIALKRMRDMLKITGKLYIQDVVIAEADCVENINSFILSQTEKGGDFLRVDAIEHFRDEYSTYDWVLESMLERSGFRLDNKEALMGLMCRYYCSVAE